MIQAIPNILSGKRYVSKSLNEKLVIHLLSEDKKKSNITHKEREVLYRICNSRTPKEIAHELDLSLNTVQTHIRKLMKKFKVNRTVDLIMRAISEGYYIPN